MFEIGDTVKFGSHDATITRVYRNGNVALEYWVQTFGMTKPQLWKERSVPTTRLSRICAECGCTADEFYHDPRDPPLDTVPCLCADCRGAAAEEEIGRHEFAIELLRDNA